MIVHTRSSCTPIHCHAYISMSVYLDMGVYFLRCSYRMGVYSGMGVYSSRAFNQANTVVPKSYTKLIELIFSWTDFGYYNIQNLASAKIHPMPMYLFQEHFLIPSPCFDFIHHKKVFYRITSSRTHTNS